MRFKYEVELTRRVRQPNYGPYAFRNDMKRVSFPFGKGKEYPTGKKAREAALEYAKSQFDVSSEVELTEWRGDTGYTDVLKEEKKMFDRGWKK